VWVVQGLFLSFLFFIHKYANVQIKNPHYRCSEVPAFCLSTDDNQMLCQHCANKFNVKGMHNPFVQSMISNLQMSSCANNTIHDDASVDEETEGRSAQLQVTKPQLNNGNGNDNDDNKNSNSNNSNNNVSGSSTSMNCDWRGLLRDWKGHNQNQCKLTEIACVLCAEHNCARHEMNLHLEACPNVVLQCTQNCGKLMLCIFCVFLFI
jgi:hypothetical protein